MRQWFRAALGQPTEAQRRAWPHILEGESVLVQAPTGSGKTLAAFLVGINQLMFSPEPPESERCRWLYVSPLKALAVDVERNLRAPIAGIAAVAERLGAPFRRPTVAVRSGDTPASQRTRMARHPPDILITTPESLYLLLTSSAREILASVQTVIVDEIHSLVPTKRGAHLALSLERLEQLRRTRQPGARPLQRIGLSATQRPLEEGARLLGGGELEKPEEGPRNSRPARPAGAPTASGPTAESVWLSELAGASPAVASWRPRPVTIIDAGQRKPLELRVEVPVDDMAQLGAWEEIPSGPAASGPARKSLWPSIYPRLIEHIQAHRSTLIFVNSRRLAERLANALNETAGRELALAHHGSLARERRLEIEDRLKRGELPALVATSSLELGIDMGAVDLVIQIEAPPSVTSGLQRIGRAGHSVSRTSAGVLMPKYRGDLLACAAATRLMREAAFEETFYPRNPLDVLAQQLVATAAMDPVSVEELFDMVRRAAPFADLPRSAFEGVLDMLAGRYPSDEFAELRPRLVWERGAGVVRGRPGARRLAVTNAGTIPDRGLYGVFMVGEQPGLSKRVGELDEEMVFELRVGEVFLLGASSWRVEDITHDRVLVSPAPGQPGKMPFWHGDRPGRSLAFGRALGALAEALARAAPAQAVRRLTQEHGLDERAAINLLAYIQDQVRATGEVPSHRTLVMERFLDEVGDWRVCILSPLGARVHAPWATAVLARWREQSPIEIDVIWSDDGIVFRLPESDEPPDISLFIPSAEEVQDLILRSLGTTALFAARFRENAARALLLPRRAPGRRSPLWAQRKRAADLLAVAARYGSFPLILETYRECLREVFDLPGLLEVLRQIAQRQVRVVTVDSRSPSPFAAALLFSYVGNFVYETDAPLAERRAQVLALDHAQLKELLGEAELRELLDGETIDSLQRQLQRLDGSRPIRDPDELHDLLLALGDLSATELQARVELGAARPTDSTPPSPSPGCGPVLSQWLETLQQARRVVAIRVAGECRFIAAEDAARYRDALGVVLPPGLPEAFLEPVADPLGDLVSRFARTHGPFRAETVAARFGLGLGPVRAALERLAAADRVLEGEFLPGGHGREWCDAGVLRLLKRRCLARLRQQAEPVEPAVLGRFLVEWQGLTRPRLGLDGLLAAIEQLQGAPLVASTLETEVLPARVAQFSPADLDALCAAGEVLWRGLDPVGPYDGRIALYLPSQYARLALPPGEPTSPLAAKVRDVLARRGALFFADLQAETGAFSEELLAALWELVWAGLVTNDTLAPVRSLMAGPQARRHHRPRTASVLRRRTGPPGSEGRWSLLPPVGGVSDTQRLTALALQLLDRYGVLTRELVHAEGVPGGFAAIYEVLKAMEERGQVRRGYFVAGLGATQFALPGAADRLRALRDSSEPPHTLLLAATDPANPYGAALPWPAGRLGTLETPVQGVAQQPLGAPASQPSLPAATESRAQAPGPSTQAPPGLRPQRAAGAQVLLHQGALVAWVPRTERTLLTFLPETEPERSQAAAAVARLLAHLVDSGRRRAVLVSQVDDQPVAQSFLSRFLLEAGFSPGSRGYLKRASQPTGKWLTHA